jgi:hypothetical protein
MYLPRPRRPLIRNSRANAILDWVDAFSYVFWIIFSAVAGIMFLVEGMKFIPFLF